VKRLLGCLLVFGSAAHACDLNLEPAKAGSQVHARVTCGGTVIEDSNLSLKPKGRTCAVQIKGIGQIDRNAFTVSTKCGDVNTALVFQLVDDDTLRITNAENY
jgi:hypothetical protein